MESFQTPKSYLCLGTCVLVMLCLPQTHSFDQLKSRTQDFLEAQTSTSLSGELSLTAHALKDLRTYLALQNDVIQRLDRRILGLEEQVDTIQKENARKDAMIRAMQFELVSLNNSCAGLLTASKGYMQSNKELHVHGAPDDEISRQNRFYPLPMVSTSVQKENYGFYARLSQDALINSPSQYVIMDNVITNVGGAYNGQTGRFICRRPGLYLFSVTMLALRTHVLNVVIKKDSTDVAYLYARNQYNWGPSSVTIVIELAMHNQVYLQTRDNRTDMMTTIYQEYSLFSGTCLSC